MFQEKFFKSCECNHRKLDVCQDYIRKKIEEKKVQCVTFFFRPAQVFPADPCGPHLVLTDVEQVI